MDLVGIASRTDTWYTMWDAFGPYEEKVASGAFRNLDHLVHRVDHIGIPVGSTMGRNLDVWEDSDGLKFAVRLDMDQPQSRDLAGAVRAGHIVEASFYGMMMDWEWDEDYERVTLGEIDLTRGDTATCTYGANPFTSTEIAAQEAVVASKDKTRSLRQLVRLAIPLEVV